MAKTGDFTQILRGILVRQLDAIRVLPLPFVGPGPESTAIFKQTVDLSTAGQRIGLHAQGTDNPVHP
jgi:hypothetical protein